MKNKKIIIAVSIILPIAVAVLFGVKIQGFDFSFLPPIYATINGVTALILLVAVYFVKEGNQILHERLIILAIACSLLFLGMYIVYHATSDPTQYGGDGIMKYIYYIILISHIILSIIVVPLVLFSVFYAKSSNFVAHKKIVRWSFPVWLYVAISGVVVYIMISPYYI